MKKLRSGLSIACAVSLVAVVGCQVRPPVATTAGESNVNLGGNGRVAGQPAGQARPGQAGAGQAGAAGAVAVQPASTDDVFVPLAPGEVPKARVAGTPSRSAVLAQVAAMPVKAEQGGLYKSADGTLQAVIPPGALSADAEVKFAQLKTDELTANAIMTPGLIFAMDLGGAALKDGQAIVVKAPVDPRFVEEFQRSAPGKDPSSAGLSQENGVWYLSMPVKAIAGDKAETLQTNHIDGDLATVEMQPRPSAYGLKGNMNDCGDGSMQHSLNGNGSWCDEAPEPAPVQTPPPAVETPPPAPVQTPPPPVETPAQTPPPTTETPPPATTNTGGGGSTTVSEPEEPVWTPPPATPTPIPQCAIPTITTRALGHDVTMTVKPTREQTLGTADKSEYIQCFIGHGWCDGGTVYGLIDGAVSYNNMLAAGQQPPASLSSYVNAYRRDRCSGIDWDCANPTQLVDVTVKAFYSSDDATVDGKPAHDATIVRLAGGATMTDGPQHQLTFKAGLGVAFDVYGSINRPEYAQSPRKSLTAASGMAPVEIAIPKFSPKVNLMVTGDAPLGGSRFKVDYQLDGASRDVTFEVPEGAAENYLAWFYVEVPNDQDHIFTIKGLSAATFSDNAAPPINENVTVHRNGIYNRSVNVFLSAPK